MGIVSRALERYVKHPRTPEYAELRFGALQPTLEKASGDDHYFLNMGPQHPSMHGVLRLLLELDGERVVRCEPIIGYSHRGHEKMAERGTYAQYLPNSSRLDYLAGMVFNVSYCQALEKAFGIPVPQRAVVIRTLCSELNRISSHLLWFGTFLLDLGAFTPFLLAFQDRERILDILDSAAGSRLTYCYSYIGGLTHDIPDTFADQTREYIARQQTNFATYHKLVTGNAIFRQRSEGVGVFSKELCLDYGITGPSARASGLGYDVRKDEPYGYYGELDFDVPTRQQGDCFARYLVRFDEMEQSLRMVEQCLDQLPGGDIKPKKVMTRLKPKAGEYYSVSESPRGQLGWFLVADTEQEPWRLRPRCPSFANLAAMGEALEGTMVADTIAILGSLDIVMPEIDR